MGTSPIRTEVRVREDSGDLAASLSVVPFDDGARPRALRARLGAAVEDVGFAIVRPDAIWRGMADDVVERLQAEGIYPVQAKALRPHPRVIEELYRYTQTRLMGTGSRPMWWLTPRYYTLCPAIFLLLVADRNDGDGENVSEKVKALKGPSNPALAEPGQLRYDFDAQNIVMCVLHTSESAQEALREATLFFSDAEIEEAVDAAQGLQRTGRAAEAPLPASAADGGDVHNFFSLVCSLQAQLLARLEHPSSSAAAIALTEAATAARTKRGYRQRAEVVGPAWQETAALAASARAEGGEVPLLLTALSDPQRFFPILVDPLLAALRRHGLTLSLWDEVLLETGLAFHQLQLAGFRPNATA